MPTFGPGTLTIGATGTEIDVSCQVNSMRITSDKDKDDDKTMLCGTVKPGKTTYTYQLSGNIDVDSSDPEGLFALSQASPGSQQPFTFCPDTEGETEAAGIVIIDPLDFGADEFGDDLDSDLEWDLVGKPTYTFPDAAPVTARFAPLVINGRGEQPAAADVSAVQDTGAPAEQEQPASV